jgi:hypothetical protein
VVVELATIVALQGTDRAMELGGYLGEEVCEGGEHVGLQPKSKSPKKMGKIIQNHQVVSVTRKTEYRGGPEIIFFLEHAGELRVNVLRRKGEKTPNRQYNTHTNTNSISLLEKHRAMEHSSVSGF